MSVTKVRSNGVDLATYSVGHGPPVIFLHGGPGDTHHYMKRMAEPLFEKFQCIFFDQRGTGDSKIQNRNAQNFSLDLLIEDLLAVKAHYTTAPAILVGHSWGAMYGLFACMRSPISFSRAALISMGPMDSEAEVAAAMRLTALFTEAEKHQWQALREKRNMARDRKDLVTVAEVDRQLMVLRVKSWVFNPALHEAFLKDYFQDPPPDREVNKWIWTALENQFSWNDLKSITSKLWLCSGANDAVPVSQTQKICQLAPNAMHTIYAECGHIPWMEHPEDFYLNLTSFLDCESTEARS